MRVRVDLIAPPVTAVLSMAGSFVIPLAYVQLNSLASRQPFWVADARAEPNDVIMALSVGLKLPCYSVLLTNTW